MNETNVLMQVVSSAIWAQEQADQLVRACLETQAANREELAERVAEQVRLNQENLQRFIHSSVSLSLASMRIPRPAEVAELQRKVDELSQELAQIKQRG